MSHIYFSFICFHSYGLMFHIFHSLFKCSAVCCCRCCCCCYYYCSCLCLHRQTFSSRFLFSSSFSSFRVLLPLFFYIFFVASSSWSALLLFSRFTVSIRCTKSNMRKLHFISFYFNTSDSTSPCLPDIKPLYFYIIIHYSQRKKVRGKKS